MKGERKFRLPRPQGAALWALVTVLLALGLLTTLIDFSHLTQEETQRANAQRQRYVVNPASGEVSLGVHGASPTKEATFDVGTEEETKTATETSDEPHVTPSPAPAAATEEAPLPEGMPALRTEPIHVDTTPPPHTKDSLVSAPAPEVTETVGGVQLPKRGDKNVIPSQLYAHPFKRNSDQVLISFVILDVGLDPQSLGLIMALPPEVTVAYSPYVRKSESYSENLRALGHEVWTILPTMTDRYPGDDPGPIGLIAQMPEEEILRRTRDVIAMIPGSVGLVLPPNETISTRKNVMVPAIKELDKRGLLMLSTHPNRNIDQLTTDETLTPILKRADLVLDPEPNETQIRSKLAGAIVMAKEKGEYLVVLSSRPQSIAILADWLKENAFKEPVVLAPLSAMYQPKDGPVAPPPSEPDHGEGMKKASKEPKPKAPKPLPQDKYKQPAAEKSGGGHGGGGH